MRVKFQVRRAVGVRLSTRVADRQEDVQCAGFVEGGVVRFPRGLGGSLAGVLVPHLQNSENSSFAGAIHCAKVFRVCASRQKTREGVAAPEASTSGRTELLSGQALHDWPLPPRRLQTLSFFRASFFKASFRAGKARTVGVQTHERTGGDSLTRLLRGECRNSRSGESLVLPSVSAACLSCTEGQGRLPSTPFPSVRDARCDAFLRGVAFLLGIELREISKPSSPALLSLPQRRPFSGHGGRGGGGDLCRK